MKTMWVLVIAAAALFSAQARAACLTPKPQALLGGDRAGCCDLISAPVGDAAGGLRWVAVSWWGPRGGNLYVVNCRGAKIGELDSLGYVERIDQAPSIGGVPSVAVSYVPATGTSIRLRSVALVQYRAGQLRVVWDHATFDAAYPPKSLGPSYEERTSWRFLSDRSRIEATTVRTLLGKAPRGVSLPAERYCFRTSTWRYVACK